MLKDGLFYVLSKMLTRTNNNDKKVNLLETAISTDNEGVPNNALSQIFHTHRGYNLFRQPKTVSLIQDKIQTIKQTLEKNDDSNLTFENR